MKFYKLKRFLLSKIGAVPVEDLEYANRVGTVKAPIVNNIPLTQSSFVFEIMPQMLNHLTAEELNQQINIAFVKSLSKELDINFDIYEPSHNDSYMYHPLKFKLRFEYYFKKIN